MKGNEMNNKITYTLLAVALLAFWSGAIWLSQQFTPIERRIDCSMAEFHPDYTPEIRKMCRERRSIKT
jgi:hypothetical protein